MRSVYSDNVAGPQGPSRRFAGATKVDISRTAPVIASLVRSERKLGLNKIKDYICGARYIATCPVRLNSDITVRESA